MTRNVVAFLAALLVHGALAFALQRAPHLRNRGGRLLEVDVRRQPPPPVAKLPTPEPPKPEPPKPLPKLKKPPKPEVARAPIPNKTPPPTPPATPPPPPRWGVTLESTVEGDSGMAVAVGTTTILDPKNVAKKGETLTPLPAPPPGAAPAPVFKSASPLSIKSEPTFDESSCGSELYPDGEAKQLGIEGEIILRVEIDERGKVHGVKVIKGLGHGLDEYARKMLQSKCKFGPAYDTAGHAVPFTITHEVHMRIDR